MKFAPKPENDFYEFIRIYYRECRWRFEKIEGVAGKWMYRDLIPGMSDFDTRFILNDDMTVEDWCELSAVIGEVHLMLCEKYHTWARNLEHPPGVNPTWKELTSERNYFPEYLHWTYYHTERPDKLGSALDWLQKRPWDEKDEYFHLKKFVTYYGRYDRQIDPPINLGVHENKYPLHSRIMHYFNPPVRAAVCLLQQRNFAGKYEAFEIAAEMFPEMACWDLVLEILHADYETPQWYREANLVRLEDELEQALENISLTLPEASNILPSSVGNNINQWKLALNEVPVEPTAVIIQSARFSRTMKGRLDFYCRAPAHFDSDYLIRIELGRIGQSFFQVPFKTYWEYKTGESVEDASAILDHLVNDPLTEADIEATKAFVDLTSASVIPGKERQVAAAIVEIYDGFYRALTKISEAI